MIEGMPMNDIEHIVRARIADGAAELPLPGAGATIERWRRLSEWCGDDIVVGRLLEAHADADAIVAELGRDRVARDQWWGVWAAEPPRPLVVAEETSAGVLLTGAKPWCSGAGLCTHALITVRRAAGHDERLLCAVDLRHDGIQVDEDSWHNPGMRRSATYTVEFDRVPAEVVGSGADYLERPGFWHGGAGVAACWLGGARAVAGALRTTGRGDPHTRAHQGAVDAMLAGCGWMMTAAAAELDAGPDDMAAARIRALRVRALIESTGRAVLDHVGRALGAGPLCLSERHAEAVADLSVYLRQFHAEADLAWLGELTAGEAYG